MVDFLIDRFRASIYGMWTLFWELRNVSITNLDEFEILHLRVDPQNKKIIELHIGFKEIKVGTLILINIYLIRA